MIRPALSWLASHRALTLLLLALLTIGSQIPVVQIGGIPLNNSVDVWFVEGDPVLEAYHRFQRQFFNDEVVVVALSDPEGILRPEPLALIDRVTKRIADLSGVRDVLSLATVKDVRLSGDSLEVAPLLATLPRTPEQLAAVKARVEAEPLIRDHLLDPGAHTTVLVARMETMEDVDRKRHEVLLGMEEILADELGKLGRLPPASSDEGPPWQMAGIGVLYDALNQASGRDAALFMSLALLLILASVGAIFRKPGPVVLTVASVVLATLLTLGVFAAAGREFNMVTMLVPTLVLIVGILDAIHVLNHTALALGREGLPDDAAARRSLVAEAMAEIAWPCLLTSLTTAVGFAALLSSRMAAIQELGLFCGVGVMVAWAVTQLLFAALLPLGFFLPRPVQPRQSPGLLDRSVIGMGEAALKRPGVVLVGAALVLLLGAAGIARLKVDTFSIGFFPEDHRVRRDSDGIEAGYGFYTPLEFTVTASGEDGVRAPKVLQAIARWQRAMEADPDVSRSASLADIVSQLNQVLGDGRPESRRVPDDPNRIAQALEFYDADPDSERRQWATSDYRSARVTASVRMMSSAGIAHLLDRLEAEAGDLTSLPGVTLERSGYLPLYVEMMRYVVRSQVWSFALAFGIVFLLIGIIFRSVRAVAQAILPNLVPVFATLGLMGWVGIRLDVATVTIAPIVLGIVVDDTIHFLHRYRRERSSGAEIPAAVRVAIRTAGRAMLATSIVLALGFGILGLATVRSVVYMGVLTSVAVAAAVCGDLLLLPALLTSLGRGRAQGAGSSETM